MTGETRSLAAPERIAEGQAKIARLVGELRRVLLGKEQTIDEVVTALLARGHVLLEGLPGLGKTELIKALSRLLSLEFRRIQFTPDLLPTDITGSHILQEEAGRKAFVFHAGPVFTNLLLADELNRTPPKTQAALLEAMQERTVSQAGVTRELPKPFFVLATQNPLEQAGTYPLPEAQLDRFLLHVRVDYPSAAEERAIIEQTTGSHAATVPQVMNAEDVLALQARVREVHLGADLLDWITHLVRASRPGSDAPAEINAWVRWGAGPRAGQSLVLAAKARALLHGRFAVTRADVAALAAPVLRHRLLLSFAAEAEQKSADDVIAALLRACPPPAG
jgi:MoxR-like ATPase